MELEWEAMSWAALPALAYFCALPLYLRAAPPRKRIALSMELQSHAAIASTVVANYLLWATLFEQQLAPPRPLYVVLGTVVIDTVEYWSHRLLHTPILFQKLHYVHHSIGTPHPTLSFVNHGLEIVFTTPPILLGMLLCSCRFSEYCLATGLAFVATISDHVATNPTSFHVLHHCGNKRCNLQQPFFTYWDHVCGTYDTRSALKIPFVP